MDVTSCDPAANGKSYWELQQVQGGVELYVRYGWDQASTPQTGCDGPVSLLRGTNVTTDTWYVHFQGRKGTWISVSLAPGETKQITNSAQLANAGLSNRSDLDGLYITPSPTPPQVTFAGLR